MGILARIGFHPDCNAGQQKGACNTRLLVTWELVVHECTRRTKEFTPRGEMRKPQFPHFSENRPSLPRDDRRGAVKAALQGCYGLPSSSSSPVKPADVSSSRPGLRST